MMDIHAFLGITKEEMAERIVTQAVNDLLYGRADQEGNEFGYNEALKKQIAEKTKKAVDDKMEEIAEKHIYPRVGEMLDNLLIHHTSQYGEKKREPQTIVEYLTEKANRYFTEDVDWHGKSKEEDGGYNWSKKTNRVTWLIHQHLNSQISTVMQAALKDINSHIANGLNKAVADGINETVKNWKLSVKVGA